MMSGPLQLIYIHSMAIFMRDGIISISQRRKGLNTVAIDSLEMLLVFGKSLSLASLELRLLKT
jgi:hypothetical protein